MAHPDNTFRALKDQPLFNERWQCRFGWHRWLNWSQAEKKSGDLYFWQHRHCADCNIAQRRKVHGGVS